MYIISLNYLHISESIKYSVILESKKLSINFNICQTQAHDNTRVYLFGLTFSIFLVFSWLFPLEQMTRTTPHLSYFKFCLKNENKAPGNSAIRTLTSDVKESGCVYVVILKQTFCRYTCVQAQVLGGGWSATAQLGSGAPFMPSQQ